MDNLYSSFYLYKKYEIIGDELIDLGITSIDADGTQEAVVKEECDPACGCPEPIYRWVQTEDTVCVGEVTYKLQAVYSDSSTLDVECDSSTRLMKEDTQPAGYTASTMTDAVIGDCITKLGDDSQSFANAPFYRCYSLTSVTIPNSVTSIENCAFQSCTGLTSIDIPTSVTAITVGAFQNCKSLTSITLPESAVISGGSTFESCSALTSVSIPTATTSIDLQTFRYCYSLTSVTIPSSVTHIGYNAFRNCSGLTSVTVLATTPPTLDSTNAFSGTNDCSIYVPCESVSAYQAATNWSNYASRIEGIPPCGQPTPTIEYRWTQSGTTCIGYDKYQNNIKEQSTDGGTTWTVVIPEEYSASTLIESQSADCGYVPPTPTIDGKFKLTLSDSSTVSAECDSTSAVTKNEISAYSASVTSAEIGVCVTAIGDYAFARCASLTSVTIPNNVTYIGQETFTYCRSLSSVTIPNSVTNIGNYAFYYCSGLTSIDIPSGVTSIGGSALVGCRSLTSITVDSNNTVFDSRNNCNALIETSTNTLIQGCKYTVIPNDVTSISNFAFGYCSSLTSIDIPSGVTNIGAYAFDYCSSLTSIDIPSGVTSIGVAAFRGCRRLTSITINAVTPQTLGSNAFEGSTCPIYVPSASVEAYKAASGWSNYASRIQAIP